MSTPAKVRQHIHYLTASDGTRLAWAESGSGPVLVKAANWLTHLEYQWESPVWRHWMQFFSAHFRFVRHDERGCGMSEWNDQHLTVERWTEDLSSIIDAARPTEPVTLLGISQGAVACITYAIHHPERVARLILYGGNARGAMRRGTPVRERAYQAMVDLARADWGMTTRPSVRSSRRASFPAAARSSSGGSTSSASRRLPPRSRPGCSRPAP